MNSFPWFLALLCFMLVILLIGLIAVRKFMEPDPPREHEYSDEPKYPSGE